MPARGNSRAGLKFEYRPRSKEQVQKRTSLQSGTREDFVSDEVRKWTPGDGDNKIRMLPPTFPDAEHYGLDVFVHYGIGTDGSAFLCPKSTNLPEYDGDKQCACCDERDRAQKVGEDELADALKPSRRVVAYVIDRRKQEEGPLVWGQPWTIDRDISLVCTDKETQEVYSIDDPEGGFDVYFTKTGKQRSTKYTGVEIARRSSPLSEDPSEAQEWLDYITEHPLHTLLMIPDYDHVAKALEGGVRERDPSPREDDRARSRTRDDDRSRGRGRDDDRRPARREDRDPPRSRARDEDEDRPRSRASMRDEVDDDRPRGRASTRDDEDDDRPRSRARDEDEDRPRGRTSTRDEVEVDAEPERDESRSRPRLAARGNGSARPSARDEVEDEPSHDEPAKPAPRSAGKGAASLRERLASARTK